MDHRLIKWDTTQTTTTTTKDTDTCESWVRLTNMLRGKNYILDDFICVKFKSNALREGVT